MKGLILAAGIGSRLRPLTHTGPKHIIPVANKPILLYAIDDFKSAGITNIGVVVGSTGQDQIRELLGDGKDLGVKITYIEQLNPKGLAHAVWVSKEFLKKDDFVMYLGDNILKNGILRLVDDFKKTKSDASILLTEVPNPSQFGVAKLDKNGDVVQVVEKPKKPPSNFALVGIYAFTKMIFDVIPQLKPSKRGELEITDAIQMLISKGKRVRSDVVRGWWKDTGKPEDILDANRLVLDNVVRDIHPKAKISPKARVIGRVQVGKGTVIVEDSVIKGPVIIGKDCHIGPGTYVGPYTSIGDGSVVNHCEIEDSVLVNKCTVSSVTRIADSLIGKNAVITSRKGVRPHTHRFIVGENTDIELS